MSVVKMCMWEGCVGVKNIIKVRMCLMVSRIFIQILL